MFQEFLSFLDEKIKNETTSHLTKHDKNIRPRQNQIPETQPNPNTQSSPSNQNIQDKMILKLTNIQRQIERMRKINKINNNYTKNLKNEHVSDVAKSDMLQNSADPNHHRYIKSQPTHTAHQSLI